MNPVNSPPASMSSLTASVLEWDFQSVSIDSSQLWKLFVGIYLLYLLGKYTKRVYFHPLSRIPGPTLAGASHLYEAFYNLTTDGYCKKFIDMHKQYSE